MKYARAEQKLCGCISGIIAPADGFCAGHSEDFMIASDKIESRLELLKIKNERKYLRLERKVDSVKNHLQNVIKSTRGV